MKFFDSLKIAEDIIKTIIQNLENKIFKIETLK